MLWRKKTAAKPTGSDVLTVRYETLYGKTEGVKHAEKDRRSAKMGYIVLAAAFAAAMCLSVWSFVREDNSILTDKSGRLISIERPSKGKGTSSVDVVVRADNGNTSIVREKELFVDEVGGGKDEDEGIMRGESESDKLGRRIDSAVRSINEDTQSKTVYLPSKLEDGTHLLWEYRKKNNISLTVAVFAIAAAVLYMGRYSRVKREEKAAEDSIKRELPEFINKTVLLLEGGIVINEALLRVIRDRKDMADDSYFYGQLAVIEQRSRKTNTAVHEEFLDFARRSGVRELMRIASIISDNIGKGADLTGKLAHESNMLWFARKKHAEEKGRLAETKMTMPLVILIGVLVMITIAPALMEI